MEASDATIIEHRRTDPSEKVHIKIDSPIGIFSLNKTSTEKYSNMFKDHGSTSEPENILIFFEFSSKPEMANQATEALRLANLALSQPKDVFQTLDSLTTTKPIELLKKSQPGYLIEDGNGQREAMELVIGKAEGVSDEEFIRHRNKVVSTANEILETFNAGFQIPQFPADENLVAI